MGEILDYFLAQPDEVRLFINKAVAAAGEEKAQVQVKTLIQEKLGDRYTERQVDHLVYAAMYMAFK